MEEDYRVDRPVLEIAREKRIVMMTSQSREQFGWSIAIVSQGVWFFTLRLYCSFLMDQRYIYSHISEDVHANVQTIRPSLENSTNDQSCTLSNSYCVDQSDCISARFCPRAQGNESLTCHNTSWEVYGRFTLLVCSVNRVQLKLPFPQLSIIGNKWSGRK